MNNTPSTEAQRETQVRKWIDELKEAAAMVAATRRQLESRLTAVLRQEPQNDCPKGTEPQEELVQVADEIRTVTEDLHLIASANREILRRLEV